MQVYKVMELSQVGPSSASLTVGEISQYVAKLEPATDWFTVKRVSDEMIANFIIILFFV